MKLRVVELLLVTTVPALFLATNGIPDLSLTFWSLLGGTLAAGGANAFNMVIESDTDKLMKRTANRPISTGQISKRNALLFSSIISLLSLVVFYIFTTELATVLTALAIIFYVFGYTIALKRHTSQNIVWGGIAGMYAGINRSSSSYKLINCYILAIFSFNLFLDSTTFLGLSR